MLDVLFLNSFRSLLCMVWDQISLQSTTEMYEEKNSPFFLLQESRKCKSVKITHKSGVG